MTHTEAFETSFHTLLDDRGKVTWHFRRQHRASVLAQMRQM